MLHPLSPVYNCPKDTVSKSIHSSSVFKEGCVSIFKHFQELFKVALITLPFPSQLSWPVCPSLCGPVVRPSPCGMSRAAVLRSSPQDRLRALGS